MRLSQRQAAALQPLLTEKRLAEARITSMVRAFLVSMNADPDTWTGSIDIDQLGNVTVLVQNPALPDPDAAP